MTKLWQEAWERAEIANAEEREAFVALLAFRASERKTMTAREREVLQLMREGHADKEIAARLCISVRTVKFYNTIIFRLLGINSRRDLVKG